jgi:hypothetical protein
MPRPTTALTALLDLVGVLLRADGVALSDALATEGITDAYDQAMREAVKALLAGQAVPELESRYAVKVLKRYLGNRDSLERQSRYPSYRVTWEVDIDDPSPYAAAAKALAMQRDPRSIATVFQVSGPEGISQIDVGAIGLAD